MAQAQAAQAGIGQQDRIGLARRQLRQPGVDIAAQHLDVQVGAAVERLRLAPQAGGAQLRAQRQVFQLLRAAAQEGVARVLALGHGGDAEALGQQRRHVLHRVDRAVDAALDERLLDLLGEEALAADLQQAAILDPVARGGDDDQRRDALDVRRVRRVGAQRRGDAALHVAGLGQAELGAAGADTHLAGVGGRLRRHGGRSTSGAET